MGDDISEGCVKADVETPEHPDCAPVCATAIDSSLARCVVGTVMCNCSMRAVTPAAQAEGGGQIRGGNTSHDEKNKSNIMTGSALSSPPLPSPLLPSPLLSESEFESATTASQQQVDGGNITIRASDGGVVRTYDGDGCRRRAGCIVLRCGAGCCVHSVPTLESTRCNTSQLFTNCVGGEPECLTLTSRSKPERFVLPAGGIDPGETAAQAASRETWEEGGVSGDITFLAVVDNAANNTRTHVFLMHLKEEAAEWPESATRERHWFPLSEALSKLSANPSQAGIISAVRALIPFK